MVGSRAFVALLIVATTAVPASADDPSWPFGRDLVVPGDLERGPEWVRSHPMMVSSLVVSMGDPPAPFRDDYFDDFGASAVWLWKDGVDEVAGWQAGGNPVDFVTWLDNDGTSLVWDPFLEEFESSGLLLGGLAPGTSGRVGYQVGDEPGTVAELDKISSAMGAIRVADPEALLFTNFTFYAPEREELLERWVSGVEEADIQVSTDYFYGREHYTVLELFRNTALAKGVPYWQYLNAYIGTESGFAPDQTVSDLRWQAMVGLVYGYTGHIWFFYQANEEGHPSATGFGGSLLHDGVGEFDSPRTINWTSVASINQELTNLGQAMTQLTSTDVRYIGAVHPDTNQPSNTRWWSPGAGGDPYLKAIGPAAGEGPMDIIIGYFRDAAGQLYVMVQNARHTHSMGIDGSPLPEADEPGTIRLRFDFTRAPYYVDRSRLEYLDPADGKVKVLPLSLDVVPPPPPEPPPEGELLPEEPPAEEPPPPPREISSVEVTLPPGGTLLYKYADTVPFRLGARVDGVGLVDEATGRWFLRDGVGVNAFYFGDPGDVPFLGDWDCDGVDTPGLYRRSDGFVYLRNTNGQGFADVRFIFGNPGDLPLVGDFNGDGCDTVSIHRPGEARVYIINRLGSEAGGLGAADFSFPYGEEDDLAFAGDFDGDGIDTVGLRRLATGEILLRNELTAGNAQAVFTFGDPEDEFVAGDWNGDGTATPGVFRPELARFFLRGSNDGGPSDLDFLFGEGGWVPVSGVFQ